MKCFERRYRRSMVHSGELLICFDRCWKVLAKRVDIFIYIFWMGYFSAGRRTRRWPYSFKSASRPNFHVCPASANQLHQRYFNPKFIPVKNSTEWLSESEQRLKHNGSTDSIEWMKNEKKKKNQKWFESVEWMGNMALVWWLTWTFHFWNWLPFVPLWDGHDFIWLFKLKPENRPVSAWWLFFSSNNEKIKKKPPLDNDNGDNNPASAV